MKKASPEVPVKALMGIIVFLITALSFLFLYINLRAENTELGNKVHNLELQNAELMQIRERYVTLIESLIREGKMSVKDLSASLSQKEVEIITSRIPPVPTPTPQVKPNGLVEKIKQIQREYVQDSTGTEAGQCFTDNDFKQFISDRKTAKIVERLQKDNDFKALLNAIKDMNPEQRADLLDRALNTYRKAWSELRLNPNTASADKLREGQTEAGMKAERLIAQTVVDLVKKMI